MSRKSTVARRGPAAEPARLSMSMAAAAVARMGQQLQAKMRIGARDDSLEQEADAVAQKVVNMPERQWRQQDAGSDQPRMKPEAVQGGEEAQKEAAEEGQRAPDETKRANEETPQRAQEGAQEGAQAAAEAPMMAPEEGQAAPDEPRMAAEERAQQAPADIQSAPPALQQARADRPQRQAEESPRAALEGVRPAPDEAQRSVEEGADSGAAGAAGAGEAAAEGEDAGGEDAPIGEEAEQQAAAVFKGGDEAKASPDETGHALEEQAAAKDTGDAGDAYDANPGFEAAVEAAKAGGVPLPPKAQAFMEERFGADFSRVRIHRDKEADRLCKEIGAQAFAIGHHVFFASGKFDPDSQKGRLLLAHELTHVVQQKGGIRTRDERAAAAEAAQAADEQARQAPEAPRKAPEEPRKAAEQPQRAAEPEAAQKAAADIQQAPLAAGIGRANRSVQGGWLGEKLNKYARQVPGYTLITVLVGYNPLLDESVPRTAINLVGGLMGLIPGGTALFDKLNESGALQEAFDWLSAEVSKLNLSWSGIKALLEEAWDKMTLVRGFSYNLNVIKQVFSPTVTRIINFVKAIGTKVLELIFKGALKLVGAPVEKFMALLNKGKAVLGKIFADPIQFVKNLASSIKMGLQLFLKNIKKHLLNGLVGWLTGALGDAGITLPEKFDLKGIFSLVMQILGLTYQNIRIKLVKKLGEKTVGRIEKAVEFIKLLVTKGPIALWDKIKEKIGELKDAVMNGIRDWIIGKVIMEGITWVLGLLNPAGALIKIIKVLYNVVMFFIERWNQIVDFATSVFNSIGEIANGQLGKAASYVESTIGKAVPVMIGFLASLLGLGGISAKIKAIIEKVRKPIDKAVEKVVDWIVTKARAFTAKLKSMAKKAKEKVLGFLGLKKEYTDKSGERHKLYFDKTSKHLMRASDDPNVLSGWLTNARKAEIRKTHPAQLARIETAIAEIYKLKTRFSETENKRVSTTILKNAGEAIDGHLATIATNLAEIPGAAAPKSDIKDADFESHAVTVDGKTSTVGHKMTARILSLNPPGGGITGSSPLSQTDFFKALKLRGGYIQGHLLNHHLHGPGVDKNLVPISSQMNSKMSGQVEEPLKTAILKQKLAARYTVEAHFSEGWKGFPKAVWEPERYLPHRVTMQADIHDPAKATASQPMGPKIDNLTFGENETTPLAVEPDTQLILTGAEVSAIIGATGLGSVRFSESIGNEVTEQTVAQTWKVAGVGRSIAQKIKVAHPDLYDQAKKRELVTKRMTGKQFKEICAQINENEGLNQSQIAAALGVTPQNVSKWKSADPLTLKATVQVVNGMKASGYSQLAVDMGFIS